MDPSNVVLVGENCIALALQGILPWLLDRKIQ